MDEKDAITFVINLHEIEKSGFSPFQCGAHVRKNTHTSCMPGK